MELYSYYLTELLPYYLFWTPLLMYKKVTLTYKVLKMWYYSKP